MKYVSNKDVIKSAMRHTQECGLCEFIPSVLRAYNRTAKKLGMEQLRIEAVRVPPSGHITGIKLNGVKIELVMTSERLPLFINSLMSITCREKRKYSVGRYYMNRNLMAIYVTKDGIFITTFFAYLDKWLLSTTIKGEAIVVSPEKAIEMFLCKIKLSEIGGTEHDW